MVRPPRFYAGFINNFSEPLAVITTDWDHVVIAGDFQIHTNNPADKAAIELCGMSETFDLLQRVKKPTLKLDLVTTKAV